MFEDVRIAPSILSANFLDLKSEVLMAENAGADFIHIDVMDGHFVPNLTMGVAITKQLKSATRLLTDVHLMVDNPIVQVPWFLEAGADIITVHAETCCASDMRKLLSSIKGANAKASVSIKPTTDVECLADYFDLLDMVLVMSVEPGFSGQSYIEGSDKKVIDVCKLANEFNTSPLIEVDGGIDLDTLDGVVRAGADVLVCGNAIFGAKNPAKALCDIKKRSMQVRNSCEDVQRGFKSE